MIFLPWIVVQCFFLFFFYRLQLKNNHFIRQPLFILLPTHLATGQSLFTREPSSYLIKLLTGWFHLIQTAGENNSSSSLDMQTPLCNCSSGVNYHCLCFCPKWQPSLSVVHYFQSKLEHYLRNKVPFATHPWFLPSGYHHCLYLSEKGQKSYSLQQKPLKLYGVVGLVFIGNHLFHCLHQWA